MISDDSFESKIVNELTFSQFYDFFKLHTQYSFNSNIPCTSCLCKICENCCLLVKGLNKRRKKLLRSFLTNPPNIVEKFSCDPSESDCILDKCPNCKSSVIFETFISNEEQSESDTNIAATDESCEDSSDKCDFTFYGWQTLQKRITTLKVDDPLTDATSMFKEYLITLKGHIYIRKQFNACC